VKINQSEEYLHWWTMLLKQQKNIENENVARHA
jgi:hypothetical protein